MPAYMGTDGDDTYYGSANEADYVGVFGGNDVVYTYGGHDNIVATDGENRIYAAEGNDTIVAGHGSDWLFGGSGDDYIHDSGARWYATQKIFGGAGNDAIVLTGGGDTEIYGGSGNDTFELYRAGNVIDELVEGVPDATIFEEAGDGHDKIVLATGWSGFVMADYIEDLTADNANAQDDRITWDNKIDDTVLGVEVTGNFSNNKIIGSIVRDVLKGMDGSDTLDAQYGDGDRLYGGNGDDRLLVNFARNAKLYGGADNDTYVLRFWDTKSIDSVVEYASQGEDTIEVGAANVDLNRSNLTNIENVTFTGDYGGAARTVTGNGLFNTIATHNGNDSVYGLGGDDEIRTGNGADWIEGGDGHDSLDGGADADRLHGGTGNDTVLAGSGDDWAYGGDGNDNMNLGDGVDFGYGGAGNDMMLGFGGDDFLYGDAGSDTITGDAGNDRVRGGDGNDKLYGGVGNDKLYGEAGTDLLYGGDGADSFAFSKTTDTSYAAFDRVMDMVRGQDRIDLSAIDADTTVAGNQAFAFSLNRAMFTSAGDLWTVDTLLGTTLVGDVNGDGVEDFRILVVGVHELSAADLVL
jgi:Ca2+-binding RTX toxin-like protein